MSSIAVLTCAALVMAAGPPVGDFGNYFTTAWMLDVGVDPMDMFDIRRFTAHAVAAGIDDRLVGWAVNNPACAMVMWPLVGLGPEVATTVWWWTEGSLVLALGFLIARTMALPVWMGFLPIFALWPAFQSHIHQGQVHLIAAVALTVGWLGWQKKNPLLAGGGWGLAVGLKIHAWPLFLVLCFIRRWRVAAAMLGMLVLGLCISLWAIGWQTIHHYLTVVGPAGGGGWFLDPWHTGFQSLGGALRRGLVYHPGLNPNPWMNESGWAVGLTQFVYLGAVGWTVSRAFGWTQMDETSRARLLAAAACVALCFGPLLSRYHLVLLAPVLAWGVHALVRDARWARAGIFGGAVVLAAWCVPPADVDPSRFLGSVPRFWALAIAWAVLLPSSSGSGMARWVGLSSVGIAALLGLSVESDRVPSGWARVDGPGFPLMAADLVRTTDGSLWFSGLTADRHGHPGFGWVGYRLAPQSTRPEIVASDPNHHIWSPVPSGADSVRWQSSETPTALPPAGRLEGNVWVQQPVNDAFGEGRLFLSDIGSGARTMRLWASNLSTSLNVSLDKPSDTIEPSMDSGR